MEEARASDKEASVEKMSSSEEDAVLLLLVLRRRRRRRRIIAREFWTHPYWKDNLLFSQFTSTRQLLQHPEKFQNFYRMKPETYTKLCGLLKYKCNIGDNNYRQSISIEERLSIFLR